MYEYKKLVKRDFKFDPTRDRKQVDPFGFFDLREAYINGSVPADVALNDEVFNGVQDPSALLDRPKDQFEAMRQAAKANAEQVTQTGEAK